MSQSAHPIRVLAAPESTQLVRRRGSHRRASLAGWVRFAAVVATVAGVAGVVRVIAAPGTARADAVAVTTEAAGLAEVALLAEAAALDDAGEASTSTDALALPDWALATIERLRGTPPLYFFAALVVATLLPFPVGLFYLTAGVIYGIGPALAWIAASLVVSNLILHTASRTFLRPTLEALVARRGHRAPRFESGLDEALFITLIRLTPGIPYFLQNWILAVAHLDLVRFVVLSVSIQMIYVTGFVVLGRSAFDGSLGWALGGLALLVALTAGARWMAKRREERGERDEQHPR